MEILKWGGTCLKQFDRRYDAFERLLHKGFDGFFTLIARWCAPLVESVKLLGLAIVRRFGERFRRRFGALRRVLREWGALCEKQYDRLCSILERLATAARDRGVPEVALITVGRALLYVPLHVALYLGQSALHLIPLRASYLMLWLIFAGVARELIVRQQEKRDLRTMANSGGSSDTDKGIPEGS